MRLRTLGLTAVLQFPSLRLDFGEEETALHVIHGRNEAGKSTLLRVLLDVLFGTDHPRTLYTTEARIDATLERPGGASLTVLRRLVRGRLVAYRDDEALDEAVLREWMGGYDRDRFSLLFAFDHDRLRAGGETLYQSGGDTGVSLFAAGGGVQHLQTALQQLIQRGEELFDPRFRSRSAKKLNRALRDLEAAEQAMRKSALRPEAWRRLCAEIDRHEQDIEALRARRAALEQERTRLQRIKRVRPTAAAWREALARLQELTDAKPWPADRLDEIRDVLRAAEEAERETAHLADQLESQRNRLQQIKPDALVLAHADAIDRLSEGLQTYVTVRQEEIPQLEAELAERRAEAQRWLAALAPGRTLEQVDELRVPTAVIETVADLSQRRAEARRTLAGERGRQAELAEDVRRAEQQLAAQPHALEVEPIRSLLERMRAEGNLEDTLRRRTAEIEHRRRALEALWASQTLWRGPLEQVARLPVPLRETLEHYHREWVRLERRLTDAVQLRDALLAELRDVEEWLEDQERGGRVPMEEDLHAARTYRDEGWRLIRQVWLTSALPDEAILAYVQAAATRMSVDDSAAPAALEPEAGRTGTAERLAQAFESAVQRADELADALRTESERVAQRVQRLVQRERLRRKVAETEEELERLRREQEALTASWRQEWAACGVEPRSPEEMKEWLSAFHRPLVDGWRTLEGLQRERDELDNRMREWMMRLSAALRSAGAADEDVAAAAARGWTALLEFAGSLVSDMVQRAQRRETLEGQLAQARERLHEVERRVELLEAELAELEVDWRRLRQAYQSLPEELDVAVRYLNSLREVFQRVDELRRSEQILQARYTVVERYEARVMNLAKQLGSPIPPQHVDAWVRDMRDRLRDAREAQAKRVAVAEELKQTEQRLEEAERRRSGLSHRLVEFMAEAGCDSIETLRQAVERSEQRLQWTVKRDDLKTRMLEIGDGLDLTTLLQDLDGAPDPDQTDVRLGELEQELQTVDDDLGHLQQRLGELRMELQALEGHTLDASDAAQQAEVHWSEVDRLWNEYLRVDLARRLLQRAIDEFRDRTEARVVGLAGHYFRRLTRDRYQGIDVEYDRDAVKLMACHESGLRRRIEELSDGTRDQLYLALRLAFLDRHLAGSEALPLVMDDTFVHFDDDRTRAALEVLADLSRRTQVLYFTHHLSIVAMADELRAAGLPVRIHTLCGD